MKIRYIYLINLLLCFCFISLSSQTFEEEFNKFSKQNKTDFSTFSDSIKSEYKDYTNKIEQIFLESLKSNLIEFRLLQGISPENKPKPISIPAYVPKDNDESSIEIENISVENFPDSNIIKHPVIPSIPSINENTVNIDFTYYGYKGKVDVDIALHNNLKKQYTVNNIAEFWEDIISTYYASFYIQLQNIKEKLQLNDWGYYKLIENVSSEICLEDKNTSSLFTWFMMLKSGYNVKIFIAEDNIILGVATNVIIYNKFFIEDGFNRYYLFSDIDESLDLMSYKGNYLEAKNSIDMFLQKPINLPLDKKQRFFKFEYKKQYQNEISYNQNIIDFYKDYPNCDVSVRLNTVASNTLKEEIIRVFGNDLMKMNTAEKVSFFLSFVQLSFEYKTDEEQFNYEKYFFPDELFAYPYSDCEDRSALFLWLVRTFTDLEAVGLSYPNHISAAVCFNDEISGDYLIFNKRKYIICDPTYINAPIGHAMPEFINVSASVIENNKPDCENLQLTSNQYENKYLIELKKQKNCYPQTIKIIDNDYYVAGEYYDTLKIGGKTLISNSKTECFIAKFTDNELEWISKIENPKNNADYFIQMIDKSGKNVWLRNYIGTELSENYRIDLDDSGNVFFTFTKSSTLKSFSNVVSSEATFNVVDFILNENAKLISENYNKTIAGLFAVINIIEKGDAIIQGKDVLTALNKSNPDFKKHCPNIYSNIARVKFLKNSNGIINIQTNDTESISFDKLKVENNAKIKITKYSSGNVKIDVLSGIKVGKAFIWYDLNFIKLFKNTDVMVFDYDKDHSQANVAMRSDILD